MRHKLKFQLHCSFLVLYTVKVWAFRGQSETKKEKEKEKQFFIVLKCTTLLKKMFIKLIQNPPGLASQDHLTIVRAHRNKSSYPLVQQHISGL